MRLLIAEDDLTTRLMLEAMLGKWGYEVVVARDGNEAWQALQADEPTLFPKHLPTHIRVQVARASVGKKARAEEGSMRVVDPSKTPHKLKDVRAAAVAQAEKRYLQDVVSLTGKNIQEACRISGLGRARLYGLLRKYGILISD